MCGEPTDDVLYALPLSLCLTCSTIFSFCMVSKICSVETLATFGELFEKWDFKGLVQSRCNESKVGDECCRTTPFLYLLLSFPLCQDTLLNQPSTPLSCHPHNTPIQTANSHGSPSLFILWCILLECIPWVQGRLVTEPSTPSLSPLWWIHRSKAATSSDINFLSNMTTL